MEVQQILSTLVIVIIILIIYYSCTSVKRRQENNLREMQDKIKKKDKIITFSGLSGIVEEVHEDRVIISTYPDKTKLSIEKWAIAGIDDREIK